MNLQRLLAEAERNIAQLEATAARLVANFRAELLRLKQEAENEHRR